MYRPPFHCSLMSGVGVRLKDAILALNWQPPRVPVYRNLDASQVVDIESAKDGLVLQVASPVHWFETIERMLQGGIETFVEIGPSRVLAGMLRRLAKGKSVSLLETPQRSNVDFYRSGLCRQDIRPP